AFDLLVDSADCLHFSPLVHRACNGKTLLDGHFGERREQRVKLRRGGAVALDTSVGLLEDERRRQRQWYILGVTPRKIAPKDHDAFGVQRATKLHLALDIEHPALAHTYPGRDPARAPEREGAELQDGQTVDL